MIPSFLMNNRIYELQANNQIAALLSQFDSSYVMEIIDDTLTQVFTQFDMIPRPNIVRSFETMFKELREVYPNDIDNINQLRVETYQTIINHICSKYEIRFSQTENVDLFTIADLLYDFFVARLNIYMIQFYVKYLINEKENIAVMLDMDEINKSKDPNIAYNKMAFNNDENLTAIAVYLPSILQKMANNQVLDHTIYEYTYGQSPEVVNLLDTVITPTIPIFTRFNNLLFNETLYGPIITHIRMAFQQSVATVPQNPASIQQ